MLEKKKDDSGIELFNAIWNDDFYETEYILNSCKDPSVFRKMGDTVMHFAIKHSKIKALEILLKHPSLDINLIDSYGETALHCAVKRSMVYAVGMLLKSPHININLLDYSTDSPLHCAIERNNDEICKLLILDQRIDLGVENNYGQRPYVKAKQQQPHKVNPEIIDLIREREKMIREEKIANKTSDEVTPLVLSDYSILKKIVESKNIPEKDLIAVTNALEQLQKQFDEYVKLSAPMVTEVKLKSYIASEMVQILSDDYSSGIYEGIRFQLNSVYFASMSISSEFVQCEKKGNLGVAGGVLKGIADAIPYVGAGIKIIAHVMVKIDREQQIKMLENFALLAAGGGVEMSFIAEEIARKIAISKIKIHTDLNWTQNLQKYLKDRMIERVCDGTNENTEDISEDLKRAGEEVHQIALDQTIDNGVKSARKTWIKTVESDEHNNPKSFDEYQRGKEDAKIIVSIITSRVFSGDVKSRDLNGRVEEIIKFIFEDSKTVFQNNEEKKVELELKHVGELSEHSNVGSNNHSDDEKKQTQSLEADLKDLSYEIALNIFVALKSCEINLDYKWREDARLEQKFIKNLSNYILCQLEMEPESQNLTILTLLGKDKDHSFQILEESGLLQFIYNEGLIYRKEQDIGCFCWSYSQREASLASSIEIDETIWNRVFGNKLQLIGHDSNVLSDS